MTTSPTDSDPRDDATALAVSTREIESQSRTRRRLSVSAVNFWLDVTLLVLLSVQGLLSAILKFVFPDPTAAAGWTLWGLTLVRPSPAKTSRDRRAPVDLARALVEAYLTNERINQVLLDMIDPKIWRAMPPCSNRRNIATTFACGSGTNAGKRSWEVESRGLTNPAAEKDRSWRMTVPILAHF